MTIKPEVMRPKLEHEKSKLRAALSDLRAEYRAAGLTDELPIYYLAVGPFCWGVAHSIHDAVRRAASEGGRGKWMEFQVFATYDPNVSVDPMGCATCDPRDGLQRMPGVYRARYDVNDEATAGDEWTTVEKFEVVEQDDEPR